MGLFRKSDSDPKTRWNLPQLVNIVKWVTFAISLLKWILDSLQNFPKPPISESENVK